MILFFHKTRGMNGSKFEKIPLSSPVILHIENDDKQCFIWSISAHLHPFRNSQPKSVPIYRRRFDEINIHDKSKKFYEEKEMQDIMVNQEKDNKRILSQKYLQECLKSIG